MSRHKGIDYIPMKLFTLSLLFASAALATVTADSVTGTSNPAMSGTFVVTGSSSNGLAGAPISTLTLAFYSPTAAPPSTSEYSNGCTFTYDSINDWVYLANSNGQAGYAAYGHPGGAPYYGTFSNAQCGTTLQQVTVSKSSTTVTVTIPITFASAFAGTKYMWESAQTCSCGPYWDNWAGWQNKGAWTVGAAQGNKAVLTMPTAGSVLASSTVTFGWGLVGAPAYWLDVGTSLGQGSIFSSQLSSSTNSQTISGIFFSGPIYVRLWTWVSDAAGWQANDYTFTSESAQFGNLTATDANLTVMLQSDDTGELVRAPTSTQPWLVRRTNGKEVRIPNAGAIKVSTLNGAHEPLADSFVYHYTIDTREVWGFRLGVTEDTFWLGDIDNTLRMPKGWSGSVFAWSADPGAEKSENSEFAIRSKWLPGLIPMYLVSDKAKEPTPNFSSTEDNVRVAVATSIFNNSLRRFVIGPAIKPGITKTELDDLVTRWVDDYGFGFLRPMLEGWVVAEPEGAFEKQILACLRAVKLY